MAATPSEIDIDETEPPPEDEVDSLHFDITSYPADFTVSVLHDKWQAGQLVIPDFQRSYVWSRKQASRLIESFLLGLPVPGVFLYREAATQKLLVVDGHQRLGSVAFYKQKVFKDERLFRLEDVDSRWAGKTYDELAEPDRIRLDDAVLRATVIQQVDPADHSSVYLIFERLNAGGTQLNPMEIRKCLSIGPAYTLLEELNVGLDWRQIVGRPRPDPRLKDVELVLRVLALGRWLESYEKPMKKFLSDYLTNLKPDRALEEREQDRARFMRATSLAAQQLGEKPFHLRGRLNLAAMDSVLAALEAVPIGLEGDLPDRFASLLDDSDYRDAIYFNTSDVVVVRKRFELARAHLLS
jgi:hypothetical protein